MRTAIVFMLHSLLRLISCDNRDVFCKTADIADYYWREYKGVIPHDAVPGGTDRKGLTTYIGQALVYPYGLLPASIYQDNTTAVASAARKIFYVDKNVKILCSGSPERFKWIPTDIDKIQLLTNCNLILGGVDNGYQENIGRINNNQEILIGKVIRKPLTHDGLWVPDDEGETKFTHYEVLTYDCKP